MHVVYNLIIINFFFHTTFLLQQELKTKVNITLKKKKEEERERYAQKLNEDDFEVKFQSTNMLEMQEYTQYYQRTIDYKIF